MNPTPLTWSLLAKDDPQYARSLTGEVLGVRLLRWAQGVSDEELALCSPYYVAVSE